jgi:hypothetical protein
VPKCAGEASLNAKQCSMTRAVRARRPPPRRCKGVFWRPFNPKDIGSICWRPSPPPRWSQARADCHARRPRLSGPPRGLAAIARPRLRGLVQPRPFFEQAAPQSGHACIST